MTLSSVVALDGSRGLSGNGTVCPPSLSAVRRGGRGRNQFEIGPRQQQRRQRRNKKWRYCSDTNVERRRQWLSGSGESAPQSKVQGSNPRKHFLLYNMVTFYLSEAIPRFV